MVKLSKARARQLEKAATVVPVVITDPLELIHVKFVQRAYRYRVRMRRKVDDEIGRKRLRGNVYKMWLPPTFEHVWRRVIVHNTQSRAITAALLLAGSAFKICSEFPCVQWCKNGVSGERRPVPKLGSLCPRLEGRMKSRNDLQCSF